MSIALVTGANRGIGYEVCRELARRGWQVLLGSRDLTKGEEAARRIERETGSRVEAVSLDVADPESVENAGRTLARRSVRLDALVNNAGVYTGSDARTTVETNFFGPLRVFQATRALLEDGARIVNVTSGLGALSHLNGATRARLLDPSLTLDDLVELVNGFLSGDDDWGTGAYGVSKAALDAWTGLLAPELLGRGLKVNSTSPGWARTDMGGPGAPRSLEQGAASVLWGVLLGPDGPTGGVFQDGKPLA